MSKRTSEANKAIASAWTKEKLLVLSGKGTRNWTPEQQKDIIIKGKAYGEDGKAFEGHHMKSAEAYPEFQGEADNIQFLSRSEHFTAHDRDFKNPTNGYFNPTTGETIVFGDDPYEPCKVIELSNPVPIQEREGKKSTDQQQQMGEEKKVVSSEKARVDICDLLKEPKGKQDGKVMNNGYKTMDDWKKAIATERNTIVDKNIGNALGKNITASKQIGKER